MSEQLAAQVTLGIASGDLALGEKLPSTREIARRCGVHSNTVGTVYRKLAEQSLLEFRQGSGFYVTESAGRVLEGARRLDEMIARLFDDARSLGFAEEEVLKRLKRARNLRSSDHLTLVESDRGLRDILVHELSQASLPVTAVSFEDFSAGRVKGASLLIAMFDEKSKLDPVLADGRKCVYLKGRSVSAAMAGETRPGASDMIAVVSGWDGFLMFARIMLLAAKIDPGNLIVRSTAEDDWTAAIRNASLVICDSLTAIDLDGRASVRSFRIVSDDSLEEVRAALRNHSSS